MANAKGAWIIPFLDDLREFAEEHEMCDLAADLSSLTERHESLLSAHPDVSRRRRSSADVLELGEKSKSGGNNRQMH